MYSKKSCGKYSGSRRGRPELSISCDAVWHQGRKCKSKPLTELYVKGHFAEDREEWHCEEVYTELEEKEAKESRIEYFKKKGNQQFEEDRNAEITVDLALQARAKLSDNKVNGLDDALVSEMIKILLLEKIYTIARCLQERLMDQMESSSSWNVVKLVFLKKPDAAPTDGIRSFRAINLTSVMSKWYVSCVLLRLEQAKEPGKLRSLHIGVVNGISCQHLRVLTTNFLQRHWNGRQKGIPT